MINRFLKLAELLEQQQKITDVVGLLLNIFITEPVLQNEGRQWGEEFRWATEAPPELTLPACKYPKSSSKPNSNTPFFSLTHEEIGTRHLPPLSHPHLE